MMVLVAIFALYLEGVRLLNLSRYYQQRAEWHAIAAYQHAKTVKEYQSKYEVILIMRDFYTTDRYPSEMKGGRLIEDAIAFKKVADRESVLRSAANYEEQAAECKMIVERRKINLNYYLTNLNKYEVAARYPWRTVAPDTPAPGL